MRFTTNSEEANMKPEEVKALRRKLKLTQEEIAYQIGVSFSTYNKWENGRNKPSPLAVDKMKTMEKEANDR